MITRGPRTARGKAASRGNALKHGLRSDAPVIPEVEDFDEWERHRAGIIASYEPEGELEKVLAERVASLLWRLKRAIRYETEMTVHHLDDIPENIAAAAPYGAAAGIVTDESNLMDTIDKLVSRRLLPSKESLERVIRYEAHLHRQWIQTSHELEALQSRRKGDRPSPLTRFDVAASPV